MAGKLKVSSAELVAQARAQIDEIGTVDAIALMESPDVLFVDLRDVRERKRSGYIPGSFHCPRGMAEFWVDPEGPYFKEVFGEDKRFIFHCASGWRSALTVAALNGMGFACAHLKDGFVDWVKQNGRSKRTIEGRAAAYPSGQAAIFSKSSGTLPIWSSLWKRREAVGWLASSRAQVIS